MPRMVNSFRATVANSNDGTVAYPAATYVPPGASVSMLSVVTEGFPLQSMMTSGRSDSSRRLANVR